VREIEGRSQREGDVSAMGQQALVVEAIQAGAKDFVVKPFQPSRVLEAVQRVLG
jgi:two-component system chemotaxis response regulator CheY